MGAGEKNPILAQINKQDDDMPYHHPVCPFGPIYDFSWILMKICTWIHTTSLIMEIAKIVLFFTTRGGGSTVFAVLAAFNNFY